MDNAIDSSFDSFELDVVFDRVVRSIDVGFGLVKFTVPDDGDVRFVNFPSIAIPSDLGSARALGSRKRNTFDVPVGGTYYEVGMEIQLAQAGGSFGRDVTDDFYRSPIYEALTKGALRYMAEQGDRTIDLLVLGLPLNQFHDPIRREYLRNLYTGSIELGKGYSIQVDRVIVQAQPMGAYVALEDYVEPLNRLFANTNGAPLTLASEEDLDFLNVLIVDPGEYTLDWLLVQDGAVNQRASGAASDAGRHRVIRSVIDALSSDLKRPLGPAIFPRVNHAMRSDKFVKLAGVSYDIAKYEPEAMAVVEDAINQLIDGLRNCQEIIDLIVLVGGHPQQYHSVLMRRFPAIPIFVVPDAVYANVCGFQKIGVVESLLAPQGGNAGRR